MPETKELEVAYFSMEVMLETDIPTYAGGLGVLAGDLLRSCSDLEIPACGVTLVYSGNTFDQVINSDGTQNFKESNWQKLDQLTKLENQIEIEILKTQVKIDCWRYDMVGHNGFVVPVFLLDTDISQNPDWARNITKNLYDGNGDTRISQEIVLGVGGVKMLASLGYTKIKNYHMNEGHAGFVPLALLEKHNFKDEEVKKLCLFTTHTPVPEGHDKFDYNLAYKYAEKYLPWHIKKLGGGDALDMTTLALNMSKVSFAVSQKHKKVSENLFKGYKFDYVTNGIHLPSWVSPSFQDLYNEFLPGWEKNPEILSEAPEKISNDALWTVHKESKRALINYVNAHLTSVASEQEKQKPRDDELFDLSTLTLSLARRPVAYKRPLLLYSDLERFIRIGVGKLQIIQCGKSHPGDDVSQSFVKEIVRISKKLRSILKVVYLENYSPKIARLLVSGSDLWLNTPRRPLEASGTSGMKAAANAILNFSILDGWWIEGFKMNPAAGFSIGPSDESVTPSNDDTIDSVDLYDKLQWEIIPMYYNHRSEWIKRMKNAITLASYFNTNRVAKEYQDKGWNL
ncbi:MAG: alpha-glucan family phosphorylase [Candidatus Woesebacteria bacterium]|nr:MAG: alpha-glucan family phosphorylase [Candidatus Woesebacteria bacterium]